MVELAAWHVAMAILLLAEHAARPFDRERALHMALVHDVVEILAGDTFVYDEANLRAKWDAEHDAADQLFSRLPPDQGERLRELWEEYEARQSAEAQFVYALDRMLPVLANAANGGGAWKQHGVTREQVMEKNLPIARFAPALWAHVEPLIASVFAAPGRLPPDVMCEKQLGGWHTLHLLTIRPKQESAFQAQRLAKRTKLL